jgi:hypothetical protein
MKTATAILALLLLGLPSVAPLLAQNAEAALPACCRRDGKHHCTMLTIQLSPANSSRPAISRVDPKCPLFPRTVMLTAHNQPILAVSVVARAAMVPQFISAPVSNRHHCVSLLRLYPKRGPPHSFLGES